MSMLPIMSVSGIRGKVGEDLSAQFVSAAAYLQTKFCGPGRIIVGRDTRPSGIELSNAAFQGIRKAGGVPVDIGIAPTPTACFAVKHFGAQGGIIITASHNPLPYNGYKMVHHSGRLFNQSECEQIYASLKSFPFPLPGELSSISETPVETADAVNPHIEGILQAVDVKKINSAGIKIAVDSVNGAAGIIFPELCKRLGVEWEGVNCNLDGNFVHNPEPRPEHLHDLMSKLKSGTDFSGGFAFDPDADRLAPVGERGEPVSEEMTLALSLNNVLLKKTSSIATNLSTSMVVDDVARKYGVKVIRTKIGEANVVEAIISHGCLIGGEGNGGVIYPKVAMVRDGLTALALILELIAKTGKRITELVKEWPEYRIVKEKISLKGKTPMEIISRIEKIFADEKIDTLDGIKIIRKNGWVHVRQSNTEPIIRCYAEAKTEKEAKELTSIIMENIG